MSCDLKQNPCYTVLQHRVRIKNDDKPTKQMNGLASLKRRYSRMFECFLALIQTQASGLAIAQQREMSEKINKRLPISYLCCGTEAGKGSR